MDPNKLLSGVAGLLWDLADSAARDLANPVAGLTRVSERGSRSRRGTFIDVPRPYSTGQHDSGSWLLMHRDVVAVNLMVARPDSHPPWGL